MKRVAVYYSKYPHLADRVRMHADPIASNSERAIIDRDLWLAIRDGKPYTRPVEVIPADFDIEKERRRLTQGGCCGEPSRG
ncbi:hypothetical protein ACERK3_09740 [Phycisphaerales bacterium AB-hyl4]|uniref:Uncharacterized protein n=1 Tax=Natronomicrosphaera hydrolytica TaxID=3242702 RepID=A0ABV4U4Q0_9BACT